jgi:hypothetical protein
MRGRLRAPAATGLVLGVGLLAIVGVALVILSRSAPRRSGANSVPAAGFAIELAPHRQLCQGGELLPGDTGAMLLDAASGAPAPALAVDIAGPTGVVSRGDVSAGWRAPMLRIELTHVPATVSDATVCIRNLGTRQVTFAGAVPDAGLQVQRGDETVSGRLRIEYLRPGGESWWQLLATLAHRFSLGRSGLVSGWALEAVPALMLLAVGLAVRTMLREKP